jgi:exonuclease III
MRILFWNIRGLGKSRKRNLVKDHIMLEDMDLVAIQETIKQSFEDKELKEMSGNKEFSWFWSPAKGHSSGLITGVNLEGYEVEQCIFEVFFLGSLVRNRKTNFRFWVLNIYGPANHEFSSSFIEGLCNFCRNESLPILFGGDFNLIRNNKERNKGQGDPKLMELFNDFIGDFQLRDLHINGVKFSWTNKQQDPIMEKLDRVLMTSSWDIQYANSYAWFKARVGSDHSPLVLDTGEKREPRTKYFYFQERWFHLDNFDMLVKNKWVESKGSMRANNYSLDKWHGCL